MSPSIVWCCEGIVVYKDGVIKQPIGDDLDIIVSFFFKFFEVNGILISQ